MHHRIYSCVCICLTITGLALGQAAQKGIDMSIPGGNRFSMEYVHYRPAKWETEQVVEIERDFPNQGGLVYLYLKNITEKEQRLRFWQYNDRDRTYWLQGNLISWDRTLKKNLKPDEVTVVEICGISKHFATQANFSFAVVDNTWEPALRHTGVLQSDTVNVSYIRVLPQMDALEVHLRYTDEQALRFDKLSIQGHKVVDLQWRGQSLLGPGHAIAQVKLSNALNPSELILLKLDAQQGDKQRRIYAHRRAFLDYFPIGTWGIDSENHEFLHGSHMDTGIRAGSADDAFFSKEAPKFGFRTLTHVGHWPRNLEYLKSLSGHPVVFAWLLGDEPDWSSHPQKVFTNDRIVKELDSTKPTTVTLCRNVKFMEFAPIVDIPCMDHYCVTAPTASVWEYPYGGRLEETGFYTRDLKYAAEPKPIFVWSQGIREWDERPKRGTPTIEELTVQLIQNLGNGANGILWFTWKKHIAQRYPELHRAATAWNRVMQVMKADFQGCEPADLDIKAPEKIDAMALLGWDKIILCLTNKDYQIHDEAYPFVDQKNVKLTFCLPAWMKPQEALRVTGEGVFPCKFSTDENMAIITLGKLHDGAILVVSNGKTTSTHYHKALLELKTKAIQLR